MWIGACDYSGVGWLLELLPAHAGVYLVHSRSPALVRGSISSTRTSLRACTCVPTFLQLRIMPHPAPPDPKPPFCGILAGGRKCRPRDEAQSGSKRVDRHGREGGGEELDCKLRRERVAQVSVGVVKVSVGVVKVSVGVVNAPLLTGVTGLRMGSS